MTTEEARLKISIHAGKTENFLNGYRYALKYGFRDLEDMQQISLIGNTMLSFRKYRESFCRF